MDAREIIRRSIRAFFIIFAMATMGFTVVLWFFAPGRVYGLHYLDIVMLLFLALVTSQASWVFYSRNDLTYRAFFLRRIAHFLIVQGTGITCIVWITHVREQVWFVSYIFGGFLLVLSISIVYATVTLVDSFNFKKVADEMNKRLKERYGD